MSQIETPYSLHSFLLHLPQSLVTAQDIQLAEGWEGGPDNLWDAGDNKGSMVWLSTPRMSGKPPRSEGGGQTYTES